jgi:4'-phosphopantetheinyl transferase
MYDLNDRNLLTLDRCPWPSPSPDHTIEETGPNDVEVWCAALDTFQENRRAGDWLSRDELERAARFRFDRDRQRFVLHRTILRALLARYLMADPGQIAFAAGARGKPMLSPLFAGHRLRFNLSHSQNLALFAFARDREVGIDVEAIRPMPDAAGIARRYFSPRENAEFKKIVPELKLEAFFNCWTRKEAFVKATGEGLERRLDSFDVSLAPGEPARLLATGEPTGAWSLHDLAPAPGFRAAVAAAGEDWTIHCWRWTWSPTGQTSSTSGNI